LPIDDCRLPIERRLLPRLGIAIDNRQSKISNRPPSIGNGVIQ